MTQEQIEELKRLAEAATPGPWIKREYVLGIGCGVGGKKGEVAHHTTGENAAYIAAANPAAVLELIRQRDELLAKLDRAQAEIRELESNLLDATTKPTRICEACATYPCKCE